MNVDAMIKHHHAVTEVITHAMSDYASAATGTSWNKACFAFEADAILCALSRAGFRILGPDEVDQVTVEPKIAVLPNGTGVCIGGRWNGWQFRKHPDGGWISEMPLEMVDPTEGSPPRPRHQGGRG